MSEQALYAIDGPRFVPAELTRGPWDPRAQHGGPPSALLARAIARHEDGERMITTRVTVELMRPVPLRPLTLAVRFARPGKRVQLVEASLRDDDVEVARAVGLRLRRDDVPLPDGPLQPALPAPLPPEQGRDRGDRSQQGEAVQFHLVAVEHRVVAGAFEEPGPATNWIRVRHPLIAGEETSGLCRAMMAADFGNGLGSVLSRGDGYTFINPDLTVYLHRHPVGEWICLDARSEVSPRGVGLAESRLWDVEGPIGRSLQSLLIDRRAP
ncbi:MAG: thioesterase family protein [Polyangiales bacterium]